MDQITDVEIISDYQEYVSSCRKNGVTNIESEAVWRDNINTKGLPRFVPGIVAAGRDLLMKNKQKVITAAMGGPKSLLKTTVDILKEEGISKAKSFVFEGGGSGNKDDGGIPGGSTGGQGVKGGLLGDYTPLPMKAEFRPGLVNRAYISLVNDPTNRYATTHILGVGATMPTDVDSTNYFSRVLVPVLQQKAQSTVNFKIDLNYLNTTKLTKYFNDVMYALNVVYFNTSLISFASIPNNRDIGMLALRDMISADDIDYLQQLKQLLGSIPIPPNLNTLIFFLNQNFRDSETGDGLFKLMPMSFNDTNDTAGVVSGFNGTNSSAIITAITNLNASDNREIASILLRIAPNWMMPTIYDPSVSTVYSKLALTVFSNSVHKYYNGTTPYAGPLALTSDAPLQYLSFDPDIDGAALALSTYYVGSTVATATITPSLMYIVSSRMLVSGSAFYTNRFSYVLRTSDNTFVWRESNRSIEAAFGRQERSRAYLGTEYYAKLPGTIRYNGLTPDILNESVKDMLSWILSFDTIKSQKTGGKSWSGKGKAKDKDKSDVKSETP